MSADAYTRADAALRLLEDLRRAVIVADSDVDEMAAHPDDAALVRKVRDALGYAALDGIEALIARETARRDAAEMAMHEQAKREAA